MSRPFGDATIRSSKLPSVIAFGLPEPIEKRLALPARAEVKKTWNRERIGDCLKLINGRAFKSTEWSKQGDPIIRIQNLNNADAPFNYFDGDLPAKFAIRNGDLLFAWSGTPGTSFGAHLWRGGNAWLNQHIFKVEFDEQQFDKRFLQLAINQNLAEYIRAAHGAAGLAHITKGKFEQSELPTPPINEQQRIVGEIEKQFTRLDAGVAALKRVQANLKRYRAAVLKAACEGRLVLTEAELARQENRPFESGEALLVRILSERRKRWKGRGKYKEPKSASGQESAELPIGWTWVAWDQIGLSQNGRPFPSKEYQETGVRLLRPGNLNPNGKVVWTQDNTRRLPMRFAEENPDLIVCERELVMNLTAQSLKDEFLGRTCLTSGSETCLLNQRLARLTPILVLPEFVLILLKAWRFRRFVDGLNSGSLIQHMFTSQLSEFTFPLPPLHEQTRIVAEVERRLSVVDELEATVTASLKRAARLRQSILQKAFSGQL